MFVFFLFEHTVIGLLLPQNHLLMNKLFSILLLTIFTISVTSCSTDQDDNLLDYTSSVVGVWEQEGFMDNVGNRLVFANDRSGLKIIRTSDDEGVASSIHDCLWDFDGSVLTVYEENEVTGIYSINAEGLLISNDMDELPYTKISNTTLDYY
ncbi:hypothetical protein C1T31_11660 [Hanstruepera neustonica]|uniref:Lipocalin-like domain-containing protein n=2 Tax=Hanstruepera neustonica TaxID=1445657 RepID=A0A2K1DWN8_9FLAO|nr:hypothetical protein C1T31_11660 [Hanstruepera neustonica]